VPINARFWPSTFRSEIWLWAAPLDHSDGARFLAALLNESDERGIP
jgi:hypothetical protein